METENILMKNSYNSIIQTNKLDFIENENINIKLHLNTTNNNLYQRFSLLSNNINKLKSEFTNYLNYENINENFNENYTQNFNENNNNNSVNSIANSNDFIYKINNEKSLNNSNNNISNHFNNSINSNNNSNNNNNNLKVLANTINTLWNDSIVIEEIFHSNNENNSENSNENENENENETEEISVTNSEITDNQTIDSKRYMIDSNELNEINSNNNNENNETIEFFKGN